MEAESWKTLSEVYGFMGNSLLKPMSQTPAVGLEPAFWSEFPDFGDEAVAEAVEGCAQAASRLIEAAEERGVDPVQACSVEYTRLFVGPPSPAAPPWETMYRGENVTVGFGQATVEMRALLCETGLELRNENNQYEDHLGIELLYLSTVCARLAEEPDENGAQVASFMDEHPLAWAGKLRDRIAQDSPDGYFAALVDLVQAVLAWHRSAL